MFFDLYLEPCLPILKVSRHLRFYKVRCQPMPNSQVGRPRISLHYRGQLKCDGTRAETRLLLSAKWLSPFKSAVGQQFSWLTAAEVCASAVVMLDTPCSEVVWRVLATHSIRQFPLHFPSHASPYAIIFQLESTSPKACPAWASLPAAMLLPA